MTRKFDGYANTDLDLILAEEPTAIIRALKKYNITDMLPTLGDNGLWYVGFETDKSFRRPAPNIAAFLDAIEAFGPAARRQWYACTKRDFNIGYVSFAKGSNLSHELPTKLLQRIVAANATVTFTLYSQVMAG